MPNRYVVKVGRKPGTKVFRSGFPGGGGQAAVAASHFTADRVAYGTDTGSVRISNNGLNSSVAHYLGVNETRSRQTDGVTWSRIVPGRLFMTCGDGEGGNGGVYVCEGADTRGPDRWIRLDGVASGSPDLVFDGGNSNVTGAPIGPYPRHYGTNIIIDESSISGYTLIHVATVTDGAWRIKMRNSDHVAVEQVRYAGTTGAYVRCIQMATFAPNASANNYSRIIISLFHQSSPLQPVLCTNANDSGASPTLSTSTITNAPTNVQAMGYVKSTTGTATTIFAGLNYVYFSTNAFSAAAGSITMTNVARTTTQADGPENNELWISVGTTVSGANHVILVGTFGGRAVGADYNTVWRGTVAQTSSTPWSAITWTALRGATYFSEQVMGLVGAQWTNWITGQNTPGRDGTAAVSGFATSGNDPNRMYLVSRGAAYRSDDAGLHWYAGRQFGSADHSSAGWDWWTNKTNFVTTTGDWAWAAQLDNFVTEPHIILTRDSSTGNGVWFDSKTGECFIGGSDSGGTSVPAINPTNTVWGLLPQYLPNSYSAIVGSPIVDYQLNTGADAAGMGGVMDGRTVYGNSGTGSTRAIIVATRGGKGMWYTKNGGATWIQVLAASGTTHPFSTSGTFQCASMAWDVSRNLVYAFDRQQKAIWRVSIAADGTVSTATRIFVQTWTYAAAEDAGGYLDLDEANNRLWVSNINNVWYINNASTAAFVSGTTNATASGFAANYPGELAGPMVFIPLSGKVAVATLGLNSGGTTVYNPTLNGADGPRFLVVADPTTAGSWASAVDWTVAHDRSYRTAYQTPNGIARNFDGSEIALTSQGMGCGIWMPGTAS